MMTILSIVLVWSPALVCLVHLIKITHFPDGCPCPGYDCTINQTTAPYTRQPEISRPSDTCTVSESGNFIIWDLSESNYVNNMQCDLNVICPQGHQVIYQFTRLSKESCCDYLIVYFKGIQYETSNESIEISSSTPLYTWYSSNAVQDMADMVWITDHSQTYRGWTMEIACADPADRTKLSMPIYK